MEEKEIWIDSVLASMEGKVVVSPRPALLADIERSLEPKSRLTVLHLRVASIAASIVLLLNVAIYQQVSQQQYASSDTTTANYDIVNDFNVFDYD